MYSESSSAHAITRGVSAVDSRGSCRICVRPRATEPGVGLDRFELALQGIDASSCLLAFFLEARESCFFSCDRFS
jgi:hypothetical protein